MKTTPIYGLPYIEPADLVSSAPAQFKTMAEGFETALNEVDSRNTPAGVKPAIATTLEALAGIAVPLAEALLSAAFRHQSSREASPRSLPAGSPA